MAVKWLGPRFLTIFSVSLERKERFTVVRQIFLTELSFFNKGLIIDDFKVEGKITILMERFTIDKLYFVNHE